MLPPGGYFRDHAEAQGDRRIVPSLVKRVSLGILERCFNWTSLEMPLCQLVDSCEGPPSLCYGRCDRAQRGGVGKWHPLSLEWVASYPAIPPEWQAIQQSPQCAMSPSIPSCISSLPWTLLFSTHSHLLLTQFLSQDYWAGCQKSPDLLFVYKSLKVYFL